MEQFISSKHASELLGVSVRRVRQFCKDGRIGTKIQGDILPRYVITLNEVLEFAKVPRRPGRCLD